MREFSVSPPATMTAAEAMAAMFDAAANYVANHPGEIERQLAHRPAALQTWRDMYLPAIEDRIRLNPAIASGEPGIQDSQLERAMQAPMVLYRDRFQKSCPVEARAVVSFGGGCDCPTGQSREHI